MSNKTKNVISIEIKTEDRTYKIKEQETISMIDQQLTGKEKIHLGKFLSFLVDNTPAMQKAKQSENVYLNTDHIISITYLENKD
ncbi:hypothetical protein [Priestia megaterium]|uniref:hypothetical protein n=1 Tax=Priestia megaterium TaxID=1404 RepID=UPI0036712511